MITFYYRNIRERQLTKHALFRVGSWIHAESPTPDELKKLARDFNLELDLLTDGVDMYEVPRLEVEGKAVYIFTRFASFLNDQIVTAPVLIVITEKFILTICPIKASFLTALTTTKNLIVTTQTNKSLLEILFLINKTYDNYLTKISKQIRTFEIRLQNISNRDIVRFVELEGILNDFRPAIVRMNTILESLTSKKYLAFHEADQDLIEDIVLNNKQLIEQTDDSLVTLKNIREAYTAIMTNNLNQVIKLLTSLTVIFTIPTMIASLYGMNVRLPLEHHPWAFAFIVAIVVISTGITTYIFVMKDYF